MHTFFRQKRLWFIGVGLLAFFLVQISQRVNSAISEWYAIYIYPVFAFIIGKITAIVPFSIAEVIIVILPAILIGYTVLSIIFIVKKNRSYIKRLIANWLVFISVAYAMFILFCGINYNRISVADVYKLELKPTQVNVLMDLCAELVQNANLLKRKSELKQDTKVNRDIFKELAQQTHNAYATLENKGFLKRGFYGQLKPIVFSKVMSYTNIVGFFFPYTFEANIDIDVPIYTIPATMAHEMAHLRGYMKEDEANFISYLACVNSEYIDVQYSGIMMALTHSLNALYKVSPELHNQIFSFLSGDVVGDIMYNSSYWNQFEGKVAQVSTQVNNSYLKSQNQQDGVRSYGKVVDLLIAQYIKRNK